MEEGNPSSNVFPLSYAQEAIWFYEKANPQSCIYNMPLELIIDGELDIDIFNSAFKFLIQRHKALRTIFFEKEGVPYQKILENNVFNMPFKDLTKLPSQDLDKMIRSEERTKIDIKKFPIFRIRLLKIAEKKYLLLFTTHQIMFDGLSYNILFKDLSVIYDQLKNSQSIKLTRPTAHFVDYVNWEKDAVSSNQFDQQINFWQQALAGFELQPIPSDFDTISQQEDGHFIPMDIDADTSERLKFLCQEFNVDLFTGLLSIFHLLIYMYTRHSDVSVGTMVSTRNLQEMENVIGCFINTLSLRIQLQDNLTYEQILLQNQKMVVNSLQNQELPFGKLIQAIDPNKTTVNNPFFQATFLFQNSFNYAFELDGLRSSKYRRGCNLARGDLILELQEEGNVISGGFYYDTNYFGEATITSFIKSYLALLSSAINTPRIPIVNLMERLKNPEKNLCEATR